MESAQQTFQTVFPELYAPKTTEENVASGDNQPDAHTDEQVSDGPENENSESVANRESSSGDRLPAVEQYERRLKQVQDEFDEKVNFVAQAERHLSDAREKAAKEEEEYLAEADKEFTPAWRKSGIPPKPSHLRLDPAVIAASTLINPKSVTENFHSKKTREELQPPPIFEYDDKSIEPHYISTTKSLTVRRGITQSGIDARTKKHGCSQKRTSSWKGLDESEIRRKLDACETRRRAMSLKMSAAQFDLEKKIIENMRHKLSFLTNPRHRGKGGGPLGFMPPSKAKPKWGVRKSLGTTPLKANLTAKPDKLFEIEPTNIVFDDYEVGGVYEMEVSLRNVSNVSRRIHLFPPASQYFFLSQVKYPANHGTIAPGMECSFILRFCPDSLGDYNDAFIIDCQTGRFPYPISACRPSPSLTLSPTTLLPPTVVGNTSAIQLDIANLGGNGKFRIVPVEFWPARIAEAPREIAEIGAFSIQPVFVNVGAGSEFQLRLAFSPQCKGKHEAEFVMVCDNCQVKTFRIEGEGQDVEINVRSIDGHDPRGGELSGPLWFGEVSPGASKARTIGIMNETDLTFPFRWQCSKFPILDESSSGQELTSTLTSIISTSGFDFRQDDMANFRISPVEGELHPRESIMFHIEFHPPFVGSFAQWARLCVDKRTLSDVPDQTGLPKPTPCCTHKVLGIEMLGLGTECSVTMEPLLVHVMGDIILGDSVSRGVCLTNLGSAPAYFSFENEDENVNVSPKEGKVEPHGRLEVRLALRGAKIGAVERRLTCKIEHGPELLCLVRANVVGPRVLAALPEVDYGLVRWGHPQSVEITLQNEASNTEAEWELNYTPKNSSERNEVTFVPSQGTIPPGGLIAVQAIHSSQVEGKIQGVIKCVTTKGGFTQHLRCQGNVVRPRVVVDDCELNLGVSFVGVPVEREITIQNTALLSATYKWNCNMYGGEGGLAVHMHPDTGEVEPGSSQTVRATFTSRKPGQMEGILVADVAGAESPVTVCVSTEVRGLHVSFCTLQKETFDRLYASNTDGHPLHRNTRAMFPFRQTEHSSVDICGGGPAPEIDFGRAIPLGKTREFYLVVKNEGGMEATIDLRLEEFGAEESHQRLPKQGTRLPSADSWSSECRRLPSRGPITLSAQHETLKPFTSDLGNTMMRRRRKEDEMGEVFRGRGMIITVTPQSALLKPWGMKRFLLTCRNNMCGEYVDRLVLKVGDLPAMPFIVRAGVVGTPFHLQRERALIRGFVEGSNCDLLKLDFGQVFVGGSAQRTFHVFNLGSVDMELEWKIFVCDENEPEVDLMLLPETPRVRVAISTKGKPADRPFRLEPAQKMMPAKSSARFVVHYCAGAPGPVGGYLVGMQKVKGESSERPLVLKWWETGEQNSPIACIISGGFHPHAAPPPIPVYPIRVDINATSLAPRLNTDPEADLEIVVHSIFDPRKHSSYLKKVALCNTLSSPLTFSLACDGPFQFVSGVPSVPQDIQSFQGLTGVPDKLEGGCTLLPSNESVVASVRLVPPKTSNRDDYDLDGGIVVTFGNSTQQVIPLHARILHPQIESSAERLEFGSVHIGSTKTLELTISNPTVVEATWIAVELNEQPRFLHHDDREETTIGCFTVSPCKGVLKGKALLMSKTAKVSATFKPAGLSVFEETIRFVSRHGRGCEVVLTGRGTAEEMHENKSKLYRI